MQLFVFFTHLLFVFQISFFDIRRYNTAYWICPYVLRPMKFTTFIDESVEKNKSVSYRHGGYKFLL